MSINNKFISIKKSRVHNLKNVSVDIPKNKLVVITGPSGSGKSSLAFDTVYIEGQRRYIESLSSYARQFLGQFQPPDVDVIEGLSPAIAIDQKTRNRNPRSTVGTVTEIYDYMRILFARFGTLYCLKSGEIVKKYSPIQIVKEVLEHPLKSKIIITTSYTTEKQSHLNDLNSLGFTKFIHNNEIKNVEDNQEEILKLKAIDLIIDRIILKEGSNKRLLDSIEAALNIGKGNLIVKIDDKTFKYSNKFMAPKSGEIYNELEPKSFSFNSPIGACPNCNGIGQKKDFKKSKMIVDLSLSLESGALSTLNNKNRFLFKMIQNVALAEKVDISLPFKDLPDFFKKIVFDGSEKEYNYLFTSERSKFEFCKPFPGIMNSLKKKYREAKTDKKRLDLEKFMDITTCSECNGLRLNKVSLNTLISERNIVELCNLSIRDLSTFFTTNNLLALEHQKSSKRLLKEINLRIKFLLDVGLDYLTLNRTAMTLSGGESQRIRLATQIGSALSGVIYVLDEPSIGLHQKDNTKLIKTLKSLRDLGNTVLVVEHDQETMLESDHIIDLGPGAGLHGGEIIESLETKKFLKSKKSITAKFLNGIEKIEVPSERRIGKDFIELRGAKENNLQEIDIKIPLGVLTCISGVSGSGKSTLMHHVFIPACLNYLSKNSNYQEQMNYHSIVGLSSIKQIIKLDQSPIGRTPHSNPATYSGLFDTVREIFSKTKESNARGYKQGRFSFNVKGGRCEECEGDGVIKIEMHFLPDVYVTCHECSGKRYNPDTLEITYKGLNISQILDLSIEEAFEFFKNYTKLNRILSTLINVGLGYMKLGQPATTLSGGEAQRLKLAKELAKATRGYCLYILDEPTTGLHIKDIQILLKAINSLVVKGHSVIIIEHNLDVIKSSDYVIDLGPGGGDQGGLVVACGTPEEIAKEKKSYTGQYLKKLI